MNENEFSQLRKFLYFSDADRDLMQGRTLIRREFSCQDKKRSYKDTPYEYDLHSIAKLHNQ